MKEKQWYEEWKRFDPTMGGLFKKKSDIVSMQKYFGKCLSKPRPRFTGKAREFPPLKYIFCS